MKISRSCPICEGKNLQKKSAVLMPFIADRVFDWKPMEISDSLGFKTLNSGTSYSVCNSCFCENCSFLFSDIRFDEEEVINLYDEYRGKKYTKQRDKYEPGYEAHNKYLSNEIHYMEEVERYILSHIDLPERMLDWGGDEGVNTPFKEKETVIDIYDVSNKKVNGSSKRFNFVNSTHNLSGKYDLLVAMHVFEHLSYPIESLKDILNFLRPGGVIYIEVPLEKIINFKDTKIDVLNKKRHWHEHINFYNYYSLEALAKQAKLKIIDISDFDASDNYREFKIQRLLAFKDRI